MNKTNQISKYFDNAEVITDNSVISKSDLKIGDVLNDRYQILKQIDSSRVYLCSDLAKSNKLFALKVSPRENIFKDEYNLRREYIIHSQFDSKSIVTTDEAIETNEFFGFLMEYIGGGDLSDLIVTKGVQPFPVVVDIFKKVSAALKTVHEKGFIHADIKPENILISSSKEVKLTDFGLSRDVRYIKEPDKETKGTLKYLCPNYLTTGEINFSSDLFSLGLLTYELLTGHVPFESKNIMDTLQERVYEPSPMLSDIFDNCPEGFSRILAKCLSLNKMDRYQSAIDLVSDIEKVKSKFTRERTNTSALRLFKEMPAKSRHNTILSFGAKSKLKVA